MKVRVRHFAALRERRGTESEELDVPAGVTVAALYRSLFPPVGGQSLRVMYAVNQSWAPPDHPLAEGDEVAFIPPLGGG